MKKKYNLALVPVSQSEEFIKLSQALNTIADEYMLGEHSLPHITLYQFEFEEEDIGQIWEKVCSVWREDPVEIELNRFSCITFDDNIFWASLLPDNRDLLHKMHRLIADILSLPIKKTFDPHLTLISSKQKDYKKNVDQLSDVYSMIKDEFILTLGRSDAIGQFTEVLYKFELKQMMLCKS